MSDYTSNPTPLTNMMRQVRENIYERALQGKINYAADMATLNNYLKISDEIGDDIVAGRTLNLMGIINNHVGFLTESIKNYEDAAARFQLADHTALVALAHNNMGEVYRYSIRFEQALSCYDRAAQMMEDQDNLHIERIIQSNRGHTLLALQQYDEALPCFQQMNIGTPTANWEYVEVMIEAHLGLARYYNYQEDAAAADTHARTALQLAEERNFHSLLASIYYTLWFIRKDDVYQQKASDCLDKLLPYEKGRLLLLEARLMPPSKQEHARQMVDDALTIFKEHDFEESAVIAEEFRQSL
jgi:tetratricopeptide (TPR) repeat protein